MSKFRAGKGLSSPNSKLAPLSIPKVFITSDDASPTPEVQNKDFPMNMLHRGQGYRKDEDAGSTAPLLDSGAATPLCEEPSIPLNMGNFLASSQKLKAEISSCEEICLSSLDGDKDVENTKSGSDNQLDVPGDYPFVKWHWKSIRIFSALVILFAILGCFGSSFTLIAYMPQRCDPLIDWWQGKVFYELSPASFYDSDGDGIGDINGITLKLDYLETILHVDAIRLNSIFEVSSSTNSPVMNIVNTSRIDPRLGDTSQFANLVARAEKRNMSLIIDIPVDHIPGVHGSHISHHEHLLIDNILKYWLHQGVHGFYLQDLSKFAHQSDLWKHIAQWKTTLDNFSSGFTKRRIFIVSSDFLLQYSRQHPLSIESAQNQFDLIDHYLDVSHPSDLEEQIRQGLSWDSGIDKPWIMWNVGSMGKSRLASNLQKVKGCIPSIGSLMLSMTLPGSSSLYYGDEYGLLNDNSSTDPSSDSIIMRWSSEQLDLEDGGCNSNNTTVETLGMLTSIRREAVPLYMNAVLKFDGDVLESRTTNYHCKILENTTVVIERFYPRRNRYLLITNLGVKNVTHNLSNTYFGGQTLVSSTGSKHGYVKLEKLSLVPGEGLLLLLDK